MLTIHEVTALETGCPWATWSRPNMKWCENNLCGYITTPANTWSNLGYLLFALWMLYDARKSRNQKELKYLAYGVFATGIGSFVYHASYTLEGQMLDFLGMYFPTLFGIIINLRRLGIVTKEQQIKYYALSYCIWALLCVCLVYETFFEHAVFPVQGTMVFLILLFLLTESLLHVRTTDNVNEFKLKYFCFGVLNLALGLLFSFLDGSGILCEPDNHIFQGHALWHVLSGIGFIYFYLHFKQFDFQSDPVLPLKLK